MDSDLKYYTNFIFSRDFLSELDGMNDITGEEEKNYDGVVEQLYKRYDWKQIFGYWEDYLIYECKTERDIMNFANLFWLYEGYKNHIPNPYKFLSYFYYKIDVNKNWEIIRDLLDGMSVEVLHRAGITGVTNTENPYYDPQEDAKMIEAINKWENGEYK